MKNARKFHALKIGHLLGSVPLTSVALFGCAIGYDEVGSAVDSTIETSIREATRDLYSGGALLPMAVRVCWVQDPESSLSSVQFSDITGSIDDVLAGWALRTGLEFDWRGRCATPNQATVGGQVVDVYPEEIRIFYNELGREAPYPIPGQGCTQNNSNGNWGSGPASSGYDHCAWNVSFAAPQPINNYLHEFGHKLGFGHEQSRPDNDQCPGQISYYPGVMLTDYDINSVMHYHYNSCTAPGNIGDTGLSDKDHLGAELAYPSSEPGALNASFGLQFDGGLAVLPGSVLSSEWLERGAFSSVFSNPVWKRGTQSVSTALTTSVSSWSLDAPANVTFTFKDPWNRTRLASSQVVVSTAKHSSVVVAIL